MQKMFKIFLRLLVRFYQLAISPYLGKNCRFYPTCSEYCLNCLDKFSIWRAMWYSVLRILRCHPFSKGGFDPVPKE